MRLPAWTRSALARTLWKARWLIGFVGSVVFGLELVVHIWKGGVEGEVKDLELRIEKLQLELKRLTFDNPIWVVRNSFDNAMNSVVWRPYDPAKGQRMAGYITQGPPWPSDREATITVSSMETCIAMCPEGCQAVTYWPVKSQCRRVASVGGIARAAPADNVETNIWVAAEPKQPPAPAAAKQQWDEQDGTVFEVRRGERPLYFGMTTFERCRGTCEAQGTACAYYNFSKKQASWCMLLGPLPGRQRRPEPGGFSAAKLSAPAATPPQP